MWSCPRVPGPGGALYVLHIRAAAMPAHGPESTRGGPVRSDAATTWVVRCLLEKVRTDTYPSATELDLIENVIPCSMLGEYIEILLDKTGK